MEFKDRMNLLDDLTRKIIIVGRVRNVETAREIARRWLNY